MQRARDAHYRDMLAACIVANRIPVFSEGATALRPEDFCAWLVPPPEAVARDLASRDAATDARVAASDERQRLKNEQDAASPTT
ncbi:MAG: hypothetical protein ACPG5O_11720 [Pseudoalteromonas tetraodonis]